MLSFDKFLLLETNITIEKANMNLELNHKGYLLPPFQNLNNEFFYVFKNISYNDFVNTFENDDKVTYLKNTIYKDNKEEGRKKLDNNEIFNEEKYYYYQIFKINKILNNNKELLFSLNYNLTKDDNNYNWTPHLDNNQNKHFIIIEKNTNVSTVKLNGNSKRTFSGENAENILHKKFGWIVDQTKIQNKLNLNDQNLEILPKEFEKSMLYKILGQKKEILETNKDFFTFNNQNLSKYDLVIPNNASPDLRGKKIEVKKYGIEELFGKLINNRKIISNEILLAEQMKISNKHQLKKLIDLYKYRNPDVDVEPLLINYNNDRGETLSNLFKYDYNGEHKNLINNIRNFYNSKIEIIFESFERIGTENLMRDVYGIYFFNNETGVDGFLIKIKDENNINNITFKWIIKVSHWGLKRIQILYQVKKSAKRLVWLGDNNPLEYKNTFAETFEIGDLKKSIELKMIDNELNHRPILKNTSKGTIQWDSNFGYWLKISDYEEKGLDIKGKSSI